MSDLRKDSERTHLLSDLLQSIKEKNKIHNFEQLAKSFQIYCRAEITGGADGLNVDEASQDEGAKIRSYAINEVMKFLYPKEAPKKVIECGSSGDIAVAVTLQDSQIDSIDEEADFFALNSFDGLPKELFEAVGRRKPGTLLMILQSKIAFLRRRNENFLQKAVPNLIQKVQNAHHLSAKDNTYDLALVQGSPEMLDFIDEMARVIKSNAYIVSIVYEIERNSDFQSAYETAKYSSWQKYSFISDEKLEQLSLKRINTPDHLKALEDVVHWNSKDHKEYSAGFVFEIFQKL